MGPGYFAFVYVLLGLGLVLAIGSLLLNRFARRQKLAFHAIRDELVAACEQIAGRGEYVFGPDFSQVLYLGTERPVLVKARRRGAGIERLEIHPAHIVSAKLEADPIEQYKRRGLPVGPQHDRFLRVTLLGDREEIAFLFETVAAAHEWLRRVEVLAAAARSGSTTLRS